MKRKKLTPKQRVLKKFPTAFVESNGTEVFQVVIPMPYGRAQVLGYATTYCRSDLATKRKAWADAARRL